MDIFLGVSAVLIVIAVLIALYIPAEYKIQGIRIKTIAGGIAASLVLILVAILKIALNKKVDLLSDLKSDNKKEEIKTISEKVIDNDRKVSEIDTGISKLTTEYQNTESVLNDLEAQKQEIDRKLGEL